MMGRATVKLHFPRQEMSCIVIILFINIPDFSLTFIYILCFFLFFAGFFSFLAVFRLIATPLSTPISHIYIIHPILCISQYLLLKNRRPVLACKTLKIFSFCFSSAKQTGQPQLAPAITCREPFGSLPLGGRCRTRCDEGRMQLDPAPLAYLDASHFIFGRGRRLDDPHFIKNGRGRICTLRAMIYKAPALMISSPRG